MMFMVFSSEVRIQGHDRRLKKIDKALKVRQAVS